MSGMMIMVSGLPGAGKSTFAQWLGQRLAAPVVSYDRLLQKVRELDPKAAAGGQLAYELFLFELEEHMGCRFIADYIFSTKQQGLLQKLVQAHACQTVNVHFNCTPETAYARYIRRNGEEAGQKTRPGLPFAAFEAAALQNRDFLWGDVLLQVDAEDFSKLSYESILGGLRGVIS